MIPPRFDRLARIYAVLEAVTFGSLLQRCRTAHLGELSEANRVLILGEGDGRFLAAFLIANTQATVEVIEVSAGMVEVARRRIAKIPGAEDRVRWLIADALQNDLPTGNYDLIITNFFLDCFTAGEIGPLIARLAAQLVPGGCWIVGDFALPPTRIGQIPARIALALMYVFFRLVTRIPAGRLTEPEPFLRQQGLQCERTWSRFGDFLSATLWRKGSCRGAAGAVEQPIREVEPRLHEDG